MCEKLALAIGRYELASIAKNGGPSTIDFEHLTIALKETPAENGIELVWKLAQSDKQGQSLPDILVTHALSGQYEIIVAQLNDGAFGRPADSWEAVVIRDAKRLMAANSG